jgi:hypothetical protein
MGFANYRSLYDIFIEFPIIVESVQHSLVSPAAQSISSAERNSRTQELVDRLRAVQEALKQVSQSHPLPAISLIMSTVQPR